MSVEVQTMTECPDTEPESAASLVAVKNVGAIHTLASTRRLHFERMMVKRRGESALKFLVGKKVRQTMHVTW